MLNLYKVVSEMITAAVITQGPIATKTPLIRGMRTIKKEILKLVETFVLKNENDKQVMDTFIPSLFEAILGDYKRSIDLARDSEVLSATASIIGKLKVRSACLLFLILFFFFFLFSFLFFYSLFFQNFILF